MQISDVSDFPVIPGNHEHSGTLLVTMKDEVLNSCIYYIQKFGKLQDII